MRRYDQVCSLILQFHVLVLVMSGTSSWQNTTELNLVLITCP
jgi:hypothetical protein